ncbi:MAG: ABC transporter permease [Chloroflexota bacterium]|nr:ABC transporter permease [Chloroflexota bacterium]
MALSLHIAILELKRYLSNRGELAFSVALPIVLFGLTYAVFGGGVSFHATANIVDLDGGPAARELVRRLDALDTITVRERTLESAESALDRSAILAAFVIPEGFSEALESGESVSLTFKRRGNGGEEGQIVAGIVRSVAQEVGRQGRVRRLAMSALEGSGVPPALIDEWTAPLIADSWDNPPVGVAVQYLEGEESNLLYRVVPGILVMFLMFTITLGSQTLVEERRLGTLERLMTTRLTAAQLFLGKFSAHVLRGSVQSLVLLVPAFAVLRVGGLAEFVQIALICVLVAASVSGLAMAITSLVRTRDQASWSAVFITMFMTIFGGTFFDVGDGLLEVLSRFTLNRYAIESMVGILERGQNLGDMGVELGVQAGVGVCAVVLAAALFRTSEGRG